MEEQMMTRKLMDTFLRSALQSQTKLPKFCALVLLVVLGRASAMAQPHPATNGILPSPLLVTQTNGPALTATTSAAALSGYVPDDKYKLRIGDKVSFQILEDREAPKALVLADSGELDVPYLGRIAAADKTCKQLAAEIKTQLEKEFYYRASVVLALDSASRLLGRVYIWGQVRNQGPIELEMNENLTAGKAVLRAGGFGDFANKKKVKVIRPGSNGAAKQVFELNMVDILEDGQTEKDILLQSDDSVIVGSRLINF
jgi:polysaccharide export outer membrane protein